MSTQAMRGVYTIPSTPYTEQGALDVEGLRRIVDFCVGCGAHGIVSPVNASEFTRLTDEERLTVTRTVVEQTAGRAPVVIGVAGVSTPHAVMFSRYAAEVGADGVIAMPPYIQKVAHLEGLRAYYGAIADAARLPVHVQNCPPPVGTDLSADTIARLVNEIEHVDYVKEETIPATHKLSQLRERCGDKLQGVFGGSGGRYLLLEHPRGSAGNMPGCHITDVVVRLWDALEAGDLPEAQRVYSRMAPLFALEMQCPGAVYKEVLVRRGVIDCAISRNASPHGMDAEDHRALTAILADLEPLFTWHA